MTSASVGPQRYQRRYAATEECATTARRDVVLALETWGLAPLAFAAEHIVTELVANALRHTSATAVKASVTRTGARSARIVVTDTSRAEPTAGVPSGEDENGRGLLLVEALASSWGYELLPGGKRVWAEVRVEAST